MSDVSVELCLDVKAEHGEGPFWDEISGKLWWVDITGKRVHCFDPILGSNDYWVLNYCPGGIVLDQNGTPIVATPDGLATVDMETGASELFLRIEAEKTQNRTNDMKVDSRGRIWVGTMALDKSSAQGALYRVDRDIVTCVVQDLTISNGPAINEIGGCLYLADTAKGIVDVFDFDIDTGELWNRRPFLDFKEVGFWPDGMTLDDEGMLWLALGRSGAVHRYSPTGKLEQVVSLPTSNPTSLTFGGPDRRDMYITSSWTDLSVEERSQQPLAGALFKCRPGARGMNSLRYQRFGPLKEKINESYYSKTK